MLYRSELTDLSISFIWWVKLTNLLGKNQFKFLSFFLLSGQHDPLSIHFLTSKEVWMSKKLMGTSIKKGPYSTTQDVGFEKEMKPFATSFSGCHPHSYHYLGI